jgi:hypothetical protein
MRADGYKGSSGRFHRVGPDGIQVVSVLSSSHNVSGFAQFTVSLALHLPAVDAVIGEVKSVSDPPKEYECAFRVRLGTLAFGDDLWWTVEHEGHIESVGEQLRDAWTGFGTPFMDAAITLDGARDLMARHGAYHQAVAASVALGDTAAAKRLLLDGLPTTLVVNPRYHASIVQWATGLGLL